ncbi:hypothetical protein E2562_023260 [Oryza meyeriana var. granulata]|uniref:Uncharacterized protein n=1 Tax=Oryza meyeriana var. granulata TaxID=110450 RepID=A0A6G1DLK5_9ORYZ|nr:hypothetical protein E2562_023260 [Oryza meyeriana var. granulata]
MMGSFFVAHVSDDADALVVSRQGQRSGVYNLQEGRGGDRRQGARQRRCLRDAACLPGELRSSGGPERRRRSCSAADETKTGRRRGVFFVV